MRPPRPLGPLAAAAVLLACPALAAPAHAGCPETGAALAAAWRAKTPVAPPQVADAATAGCVQDAMVAAIGAAPIGWKVGLTSQAAQAQFGVDHPLAGRLLEGMLLADGAAVPADFGARPIAEADLIVTVGDAAIMQATTPMEVLEALESLTPFIELADLMVAPGAPLSADTIIAINVGARSGVAGAPVPLAPTEAWLEALAAMTVEAEDASGTVRGAFPGAAILGHPLNAVLWLTERLADEGRALAPGDVVSLGAFGPPMPPAELGGLRVRYLGLPVDGEVAVSVRFE